MKKHYKVLLALTVLSLATVFCSGTLPAQDEVQKAVEGTMQALTAQAPVIQTEIAKQMTQVAGSTDVPTAEIIPTATTEISAGSISGQLMYPASGIPAMAIVAYRLGGVPNEYYYVTTIDGQSTYEIDNLPVGSYHIVAYSLGGSGFPAGIAGGYTAAVPCGLSVDCTDHSLLPVQVNAGQISSDITPGDFYAPEGTFPDYPLP